MAEVIHTRHIGDTRSVLAATLKQKNNAGTETVVNLTGLTCELKLVDRWGAEKLAQTSTGCTVTTAASGEVEMDFAAATVDTAGEYYGYFVVTESSEEDHFPAVQHELRIIIQDD